LHQLSLHPEIEVLRQRVLGFDAREEQEASTSGITPLSVEEMEAVTNASSNPVPVRVAA